RALRGHRVPTNKLPVARNGAAKVLGPRPVDPAIDNNMTDVLLPQLLGNGRKAHQCVEFLISEKRYRFISRMRTKVDLPWVHAHIGRHACSEVMMCRSERWHRNCLSPEFANCVHALSSKQLEASSMHSTQERDWRVQI